MTVAAALLPDNTLLTVDGASNFVVSGLQGDLDASGLLLGTLDVTTGDAADNGIAITTGTGATTISGTTAGDTVTVAAALLPDNTLLTVDGASNFVVSGLQGDLDASGLLLGTLDVTTGDAADNGIAITTGTGATTISGTTAGDTVTVAAALLPDNTLLTVDGASNFVVSGLQGDLDASGLLLGTLDVTTGDAADNGIAITTGTGATTISGTTAGDTVTVAAALLPDNTLLTVDGASNFVVSGLQGDLDASAVMGSLDVTTADVSGLSIATGGGTNTIDATALAAGNTLTLTGSDSVEVTLDAGNLSADTYTGNVIVTGGIAANTIETGSGADQITGGAGADILDGGADMVSDTFLFNTGDSLGSVAGTGDSGTISGYDVISNFDSTLVTYDVLNLPGTPAVAVDTSGGVDGTDSTLTIGGEYVKSHSISNGMITFDINDWYSTPLNLTSLAEVAAVVDYLQQNDLGDAGTTVAFTANVGGIDHTFVYEQVGDDPGTGTNTILVDLSHVALSNLSGTLLA